MFSGRYAAVVFEFRDVGVEFSNLLLRCVARRYELGRCFWDTIITGKKLLYVFVPKFPFILPILVRIQSDLVIEVRANAIELCDPELEVVVDAVENL